jgi:hypothetical protein
MRSAALLGAVAALGAAPATADALETQRFLVSVKGVQTTAWSYEWPGSGPCDPPMKGNGTEVVRFASRKPKVVEATRFSRDYVQFGTGLTAGVLGAGAKVTRKAVQVDGPSPCGGTGGPWEPIPPDCGTKRGSLDLRLSYEGFAKPRGVKLRNANPVPDMFENCAVNGISFPTLLDKTGNGNDIASDWPVREIMDGRAGKTIVIGRGRNVVEDAVSRQETTIRWEVSFRRLKTRSSK